MWIFVSLWLKYWGKEDTGVPIVSKTHNKLVVGIKLLTYLYDNVVLCMYCVWIAVRVWYIDTKCRSLRLCQSLRVFSKEQQDFIAFTMTFYGYCRSYRVLRRVQRYLIVILQIVNIVNPTGPLAVHSKTLGILLYM